MTIEIAHLYIAYGITWSIHVGYATYLWRRYRRAKSNRVMDTNSEL